MRNSDTGRPVSGVSRKNDGGGDITDRRPGLLGVVSRHRVAVVVIMVTVGCLVYLVGFAPDDPVEAPAGPAPVSAVPLPDLELVPDPAATPSTVTSSMAAAEQDESTPIGGVSAPRQVAEGFATDFTDAREGWWERMSRWTSPALGQSYRTTSLDRIASGQLTGVTDYAVTNTVADFEASYDSGLRIGVRVEYVDGQWQVTRAVPMENAY